MFEIELFWHLSVFGQNLYLYKTELCELELFELEQFDLTELLEIEMFMIIILCTHANGIAWNRTDFLYENEFGIK